MPPTPRFVFISYAREDGAAFATRLAEDLARAGHHPWRDAEQLTGRGGEAWERELVEQLLSAELVVVVLTPGAVSSPLVRGEFTKALDNKLKVVPALFTDCDMPLSLVSLQYVDFRSDHASGLSNLLAQVDRLNDPATEIARTRETLQRLTANRDRATRQGLATPSLDTMIAAVTQRVDLFSADLRAQTARVSEGLEEEKQRAAAEAAQPRGPGVRRYGRRPPIALGDTFYDRKDQQEAIRSALLDPRARMVTVLGRGGMGKTALACCVLSAIEQPSQAWRSQAAIQGVVYLHHTPTQPITLDRTLLYIAKVLPDDLADKAERVFGNRDLSTEDRVDRFLDLMPDKLVIALFDNFEDLLDERGRIKDADLNLFVRRVLTGQETLRLLVTARAAINLPAVEMRTERQVTLRDGLPDADAVALLRELDPNNEIGLGDASEADLQNLVQRTYAIPRALELVANMLKGNVDDGNGLLQGLEEVADDFWGRESVVENLVEENYRRLRPEARRVAEALAVFARPVPQVAVDFLLQPHVPGLHLAEVLQPLVNARLVSVERGKDQAPSQLGLHRIDRDFLYQQLPAEGAYSRSQLHRRAAEFYRTQRRVGPTGWRSLTDLQPQTFEYEHLVQAGEYDAAALLLGEYGAAIAHCGHPTHCRDLFLKLPDRLSSDAARVAYGLTALAWKAYLGPITEGLRLGEQALQLAISSGNTRQELQVRRELVIAYRYAGDSVRSAEHAERAGALLASPNAPAEEIDDDTWFDLTLAYTYQGDVRRAEPLARQGYEIAQRSGKPVLIAAALNALAMLYFAWGKYADAIQVGREAEAIWIPGFNDGLAYVQNIMGMSYYLLGDYPSAIAKLNEAVTTADEWDSPRPEALAHWNMAVINVLHGVYDVALQCGRDAETLMTRLSLDRSANAPRLAAEAALRKDYAAMTQALLTAAQEWTRCADLFPGPTLAARALELTRLHQLPELAAEAEAMQRQFAERQQLPGAGATEPAFRDRLERVYADHPLAADTVLERVLEERGTLDGLTQTHLSTAPRGGPTDQNHVGGTSSTLAIASAVGLDDTWSVLDVGTGIGGTPRVLASTFGCRCHAIELTSHRYEDAVRLTRMVGLEKQVTFLHGDFLEVELPHRSFDLVLVQGALVHFTDLSAFLQRVVSVLRPGGRIAVEDAFLARPPVAGECDSLARLEQCWNGVFPSEAEWLSLLEPAGLRADERADLTARAVQDLDGAIADHATGRMRRVTQDEHEGWVLGRHLLAGGVLCYVRTFATLTDAARTDVTPTFE